MGEGGCRAALAGRAQRGTHGPSYAGSTQERTRGQRRSLQPPILRRTARVPPVGRAGPHSISNGSNIGCAVAAPLQKGLDLAPCPTTADSLMLPRRRCVALMPCLTPRRSLSTSHTIHLPCNAQPMQSTSQQAYHARHLPCKPTMQGTFHASLPCKAPPSKPTMQGTFHASLPCKAPSMQAYHARHLPCKPNMQSTSQQAYHARHLPCKPTMQGTFHANLPCKAPPSKPTMQGTFHAKHLPASLPCKAPPSKPTMQGTFHASLPCKAPSMQACRPVHPPA